MRAGMLVMACVALLQVGCDSSQDGSCALLLSEVEAQWNNPCWLAGKTSM